MCKYNLIKKKNIFLKTLNYKKEYLAVLYKNKFIFLRT